ncbi:MAG: potassium-transporting ATPase subunit KdpC [Acidobacteriota bacterium]|nr:potassium-transporting ATPase subunit KdpC [Acidobacteriota bacterium]
MRKNLLIAVWFTLLMTLLYGLIYPLAVTGLAQLMFPRRANGQLIEENGKVIGSRIIGQEFSGPGYFHSRPSAAGSGYDPLASGGSDLGPTNKTLIERVEAAVKKLRAENPTAPIPVDLVTTSASGLDPDISPAAAAFQAPRVARARGVSEEQVEALVRKHTQGRAFGFLGEPRVNVLELNLDLDRLYGGRPSGSPLQMGKNVARTAIPSGGAGVTAAREGTRSDSQSTVR